MQLLRKALVLERPPAFFPHLWSLFRLAILRHAHAKGMYLSFELRLLHQAEHLRQIALPLTVSMQVCT